MTRLEQIIQHFDDLELLNLKKYKYDSYLPNSRKFIDQEIGRRNLSLDNLDSLQQAYISRLEKDDTLRCPRCYTTKISVDQVEFWNTYNRKGIADDIAVMDGLSGRGTTQDKLTCIVCDYVLHDPNESGVDKLSKFISGLFKRK